MCIARYTCCILYTESILVDVVAMTNLYKIIFFDFPKLRLCIFLFLTLNRIYATKFQVNCEQGSFGTISKLCYFFN